MFIVAHECGHAIESMIAMKLNGMTEINALNFRTFNTAVQRMGIDYFLHAGFTDETTEQIYEKVKKELGNRALDGSSEMIAQAIAQKYYGIGNHPIADHLFHYLQGLLKGG